jgi:hypothetical protein
MNPGVLSMFKRSSLAAAICTVLFLSTQTLNAQDIQIDIITQRPFNFDSKKTVLNARGIYSDQEKKQIPAPVYD